MLGPYTILLSYINKECTYISCGI